MESLLSQKKTVSFEDFKAEVLADFRLACLSREVSLMGRKEVLTGKAKFGIFGDGKELAQIALSKVFRNGDFRSGYYRDQTWMMAIGQLNVEGFFAQLYADLDNDYMSKGRQMNGHYSTDLVDEQGNWLDHKNRKNSAADTSPTASQLVRALGLAQASAMYRNNPELQSENQFSHQGDEICFVSIGDASTSEGVFWESLNAAAVLKVPMAVSVWDDGYGISVPREFQTAKGNISEILAGFKPTDDDQPGMDVYTAKGWDYVGLIEMYQKGIESMRRTHRPALFHVREVTQPQGHSTSGSHERYKSAERLEWEKNFDCIEKFKEWILANGISDESELDAIRSETVKAARDGKAAAWRNYTMPIKSELAEAADLITALSTFDESVTETAESLRAAVDPNRKDIIRACRKTIRLCAGIAASSDEYKRLKEWLADYSRRLQAKYSDHLYSESAAAALKVTEVKAHYSENAPVLNGFEILNACFDENLKRYPNLVAFGEDVGKIGDVNQGFHGLQEKYGIHRVFDVGIREATIMGQAIGLSMRGIRPIAEIQYLDYLIYGLQPLCDDLATLRYRTAGKQKAPAIIRTRGHRLEGIWHTGSPMQMILGSLRGMYVCVPRNMTQAAGFYNSLLQSDDPALVIECLNGYRLKERLPDNIADFTLPLGQVEVLEEGTDISLVTYGSCVRVAEEAIQYLKEKNISVELIDVQTLLPFDLNHDIVKSIRKTNRVVFLDEDVSGGGTAYMYQQVMEIQNAYQYLDSMPITICAKDHRSAYGSDGDYFCKPSAEDVFEAVYAIMHEAEPASYPAL